MEGVLAVERVLQDYLVSVGKASLVEETPEIYSWITVHDSSTSFHGRHYHRNHAMTAVMYLDVSNTTVCLRTRSKCLQCACLLLLNMAMVTLIPCMAWCILQSGLLKTMLGGLNAQCIRI